MPEPYYQTDTVTLYRGDALAILRELPSRSAHAVITDPPYSSGGAFRGDRAAPAPTKYVRSDCAGYRSDFAGDTRDQRSYQLWLTFWLSDCRRILEPGAAACLFTDWRQLAATIDAIQAAGFIYRGVCPWCKPNARPQAGRLRQSAEFIVWGTSGHRPIEIGDACLPGHWLEPTPMAAKSLHIARKPLPVLRDLAELARPGGIILDPMMGSAATGQAALEVGRRFIGIELDPVHCATARRQLAQDWLFKPLPPPGPPIDQEPQPDLWETIAQPRTGAMANPPRTDLTNGTERKPPRV